MEKLKFDKTATYEQLEETFQQWAAQFKNMPETAFANNLEIGETLERYYITLFNKKYNGKYFIKKLEYNSKLFYKYHGVDLVVYNSADAMLMDDYRTEQLARYAIDTKMLFTTFRKSEEFIQLPSDKCMCVTNCLLEKYRKNDVNTYLLIYCDTPTTGPNGEHVKSGYYWQNVNSIVTEKKFETKNQSENNKLKNNLNCDEFNYFENLISLI